MKLKWIQNQDNRWLLKSEDYETIGEADKIEDKLLMLKEVVNYLLEENEARTKRG